MLSVLKNTYDPIANETKLTKILVFLTLYIYILCVYDGLSKSYEPHPER